MEPLSDPPHYHRLVGGSSEMCRPFVLNRYHNTSSVSRLFDQLRWPSLEQRRKTTCLGIIYKIHHGLIQCPIIRSKLAPPRPSQRCTHNQQFCLINTRTQYRGGLFLPRTVRDWNHIPSETAEATTANAFVLRASAQ